MAIGSETVDIQAAIPGKLEVGRIELQPPQGEGAVAVDAACRAEVAVAPDPGRRRAVQLRVARVQRQRQVDIVAALRHSRQRAASPVEGGDVVGEPAGVEGQRPARLFERALDREIEIAARDGQIGHQRGERPPVRQRQLGLALHGLAVERAIALQGEDAAGERELAHGDLVAGARGGDVEVEPVRRPVSKAGDAAQAFDQQGHLAGNAALDAQRLGSVVRNGRAERIVTGQQQGTVPGELEVARLEIDLTQLEIAVGGHRALRREIAVAPEPLPARDRPRGD